MEIKILDDGEKIFLRAGCSSLLREYKTELLRVFSDKTHKNMVEGQYKALLALSKLLEGADIVLELGTPKPKVKKIPILAVRRR